LGNEIPAIKKLHKVGAAFALPFGPRHSAGCGLDPVSHIKIS
jgi:hypothetical protein